MTAGAPAGSPTFTPGARRLGLVAAVGTVVLIAVYAVVLAAGILSLASPQDPIRDPWFSILEILIIALMPLLVAVMAAVHAWAPARSKVFSLLGLVFVSLQAGLTCSNHFTILVLSHQNAFTSLSWTPLILSFDWPSIPYALDILAWDVFFSLSVLFAAAVFAGTRLTAAIRLLLAASGVLALAGLSGLVVGLLWRWIGIAGYVGVFPVAVALLAVLFHRTAAAESSPAQGSVPVCTGSPVAADSVIASDSR